jgi:hypothetical protein
VDQGFKEDMVYSLMLVLRPEGGNVGMAVEYQFAFHDGRFYSWSPARMTISAYELTFGTDRACR